MVQHRQPQGQQEGITAGAAAWYATAITATAAASSPSSAAAVFTNRFANGNGQSQLEGERGEAALACTDQPPLVRSTAAAFTVSYVE